VNISIVNGWLPLVVQALAVVVFVLAIECARADGDVSSVEATGRRGCHRRDGPGVDLGSLVPDDFPWSAYLWGFAAVLAMVATTVGWGGGHRSPDTGGALGTPVVGGDGGCREPTDGLLPHVGRLVDGDPENVVGFPQLRQCRADGMTAGSRRMEW